MIPTVLLYAVMLVCAYVIGFIEARQRISNAIFAPWLAAMRNNGPTYWLRARDYSAAWNAYDSTNLPFLRGRFSDTRTFGDAPEYPVVVEYGPDISAVVAAKSHGLSTGSVRQGAE